MYCPYNWRVQEVHYIFFISEVYHFVYIEVLNISYHLGHHCWLESRVAVPELLFCILAEWVLYV